MDGCFFCCSLEAAQKVAELIEAAPLSLRQREPEPEPCPEPEP